MKRILLVNGSPRGKAATSLKFLEGVDARLPGEIYDVEKITVPARAGKKVSKELLQALSRCDAAVISFPLYAYSIPANLTQFFEEYAAYCDAAVRVAPPRLYGIVNSGYYDPEVNREALRVLKHFARRHGFSYRFSAAFGGGLVTAMLAGAPLINRRLLRVYRAFVDDLMLEDGEPYPMGDLYIRPFIPKRVMLFMKDSEFSKRIMRKKLKG